MRGRRPTPTGIKFVTGNPGRRPLNDNEPKPPTQRPSCPPELTKAAKKEWKRLAPILEALEVVALMDRSALAAYCQSYGRWIEAEIKIAETGLVIKTKSGNIIENPYYSIAKRERELMHKFAIEFGLTPAARSRLGISAVPYKRTPASKYFD